MVRPRGLGVPLLAFGLAAGGCDKGSDKVEQGAVPPPIESTKPGICAGGGGKVSDAVSAPWFPRTGGKYCLDPHGETRAYGEQASAPLDAVCTELFNGECEVYRSFGLNRVVTLRYVDGAGSPGAVNVNLSSFRDPGGAYGFFTKRVLADLDPADLTVKPLDAGAAGAIGSTIAYVWRGASVAELSYTNELETPEQLRQGSREVLPVLGKLIGERLPGAAELLPSALALPVEDRLPLGIRYFAKDALGVGGLGAGALGFYRRGSARFKIFASVAADEAGGEDVLSLLKKATSGASIKGGPFPAIGFSLRGSSDGQETHWVAARRGKLVVAAAGDKGDAPPEKADDAELAQKLELLKPLIAAPAAPASPSSEPDGAKAPGR